MKSALLLSGGMDSIALAWWKRPDMAFTVDYGQLAAAAEVVAARAVSERLQVPHYIIRFDGRELGSGDMAGSTPDVHAPASDWWPYRNQLLLTLAGMKAISWARRDFGSVPLLQMVAIRMARRVSST